MNTSGRDGISFRASVGASTKAAEVNASNLTGFNVTAIGNGENYFTDMSVAVSSGTCTAAKTYYWPSYELGFYAYANVSGGTVSITNAAKTISGVTPAAAASEQTDMIVAYETGNKTDNESAGVPLNFRHALSQVVVKAANLSTSGIQIKVAGVKIGNILDRGTFTYPAAATTTQNSGTLDQALWNTSAAEYFYTIAKESVDTVLTSTAKSIMFGGNAWMVIPQALTARASFADNTDHGSSISVMVQILDASNNQLYPATAGQYAYTNIPIDTDWLPGKKYTYTLNFLDEANGGGAGVDDEDNPVLGSPIRFTLTVDDWDPQAVPITPVDPVINNAKYNFEPRGIFKSDRYAGTGIFNNDGTEADYYEYYNDYLVLYDALVDLGLTDVYYQLGSNSTADELLSHFASMNGFPIISFYIDPLDSNHNMDIVFGETSINVETIDWSDFEGNLCYLNFFEDTGELYWDTWNYGIKSKPMYLYESETPHVNATYVVSGDTLSIGEGSRLTIYSNEELHLSFIDKSDGQSDNYTGYSLSSDVFTPSDTGEGDIEISFTAPGGGVESPSYVPPVTKVVAKTAFLVDIHTTSLIVRDNENIIVGEFPCRGYSTIIGTIGPGTF